MMNFKNFCIRLRESYAKPYAALRTRSETHRFFIEFNGLLTRPYAKPYVALRTRSETHRFSQNFNGLLTRPYATSYAALRDAGKTDENGILMSILSLFL